MIIESQEIDLNFLEKYTQIYRAKGIQDVLSHLTLFSYHLIIILLKNDDEICPFIEAVRKLTLTPIVALLSSKFQTEKEVIYAGADLVLEKPYDIEKFNLRAYALIRRYTRWESEKDEKKILMVGNLEINVYKRSVYWKNKEITVVRREFDFLYLLAYTPGRVYTYGQIYSIVWKEYFQDNIRNMIYCMVHRLKKKMKLIDIQATEIICSVKDVGYYLKII